MTFLRTFAVAAAAGASLTLAAVAATSAVYADSNEQVIAAARTATAAAKATADVANQCAINAAHGASCTPTPAPVASSTPVPLAATPAPAPTATDVPTATPAATPLPDIPAPGEDAPLAAYIRPSAYPDAGPWMELALPQGRWDFVNRCADGEGSPYVAWSNVWVWQDEGGRAVDLGDPQYFSAAGRWSACQVQQWQFHSAVPCATNEAGVCDVFADAGYWDALKAGAQAAAQSEQPPANAPPVADPLLASVPPTDTPPPAARPTPPSLSYVPVPPSRPAPPPLPAVTPEPVDQPPPEAFDYPAPATAEPTATYEPTWTPTPVPAPESTSTPFVYPTPATAEPDSGGPNDVAQSDPAPDLVALPALPALPAMGPSVLDLLGAWLAQRFTFVNVGWPFRQLPAHDVVPEPGVVEVVTPRVATRHDLKTVVF